MMVALYSLKSSVSPFTRHLISTPFSRSPLRSPDTKVLKSTRFQHPDSSDTCKREAYAVTKYPVSQCIRSRVNAALISLSPAKPTKTIAKILTAIVSDPEQQLSSAIFCTIYS